MYLDVKNAPVDMSCFTVYYRVTVNNCSPLGGTDLGVISSSEQFGEVSVIGEPKGC